MASVVFSSDWGAPRIVVFSGGFQFHLGEKLTDEPFRAARPWPRRMKPCSGSSFGHQARGKERGVGLFKPWPKLRRKVLYTSNGVEHAIRRISR